MSKISLCPQNEGIVVVPHIKPLHQDKATGLDAVLKNHFPEINLHQVLTVGDSPNDEAMFNLAKFPISVGVANVLHYQDKIMHLPQYVTHASEFAGFLELVTLLLKNSVADDSM